MKMLNFLGIELTKNNILCNRKSEGGNVCWIII